MISWRLWSNMSYSKSAKIVTKPCYSNDINYAKVLMQYYFKIIVDNDIYNEKSCGK